MDDLLYLQVFLLVLDDLFALPFEALQNGDDLVEKGVAALLVLHERLNREQNYLQVLQFAETQN